MAARAPRPSARPGRPEQPSAERIAPCSAAALRPACRGRRSALRHRREAPEAGPGRQPAVTQAELRQQEHPQAVYHPEDQVSAPRRRGPASLPGPRRDVRAAEWGCRHPGPAWLLERVLRREPALAILQPEACRDVRRAEARPDGPAAVPRGCCQEPGLRSVRVWPPGQARPDGPGALRSEQGASPWAQARAVPKDPLLEAAEVVEASESGAPQAAGWARAAAEQRPAAALAAWGSGVPLAAVSGHAAAGPQPAAAKAASERPAAEGAAAGPDGPQVAAEAEAAPLGAAVRLRAEARRADGAVQPRAAVRPGARAQQAARPLAPSAAASVFRQGPSLEAGPARPRAAAHFALAMRSLRIASRSEPSSRAARNEDWSWW